MKLLKTLLTALVALAFLPVCPVLAEELPSHYSTSYAADSFEALSRSDGIYQAYDAALAALDAGESERDMWHALVNAQYGYYSGYAVAPEKADHDLRFIFFFNNEAWSVSVDTDGEKLAAEQLSVRGESFTDATAYAFVSQLSASPGVIVIDNDGFWECVYYFVVEIADNLNAQYAEKFSGAGKYPGEAKPETRAELEDNGWIKFTVSVKLKLVEGMSDFVFRLGDGNFFNATVHDDGTVTGTYQVKRGGIYIVRLYFKINGESSYAEVEADVPKFRPELRNGDNGQDVLDLQNLLRELGIHTGRCDGDFGPQTERSVRAFQNSLGLPDTGVVDEATWAALEPRSSLPEPEEEPSAEESPVEEPSAEEPPAEESPAEEPPVEEPPAEEPSAEEPAEDALPEDGAPIVSGFEIAASSIREGETAAFTLSFENVQPGDALEIEMRVDNPDYNEIFGLTAPASAYERAFSEAGERGISFRVRKAGATAWSAYCETRTLTVLPREAEVLDVSLDAPSSLTCVESADGLTVRVTVTCNEAARVADMYVGDSANNYVFAEGGSELPDGRRLFVLEHTLGGGGKSYAGDYALTFHAARERYSSVYDTYDNFGTLRVEHDWDGGAGDPAAHPHRVTYTCVVCGAVKMENRVDDYRQSCAECLAGLEVLTNGGVKTVTGDDGSRYVSKNSYNKAVLVTPYYYVEPGQLLTGDVETLDTIIRQFDVMNAHGTGDLYMPGEKSSYCTTFVRDVSSAMGAFYPAQTCKKCHKAYENSIDPELKRCLVERGLYCSCASPVLGELQLFYTSAPDDPAQNAWAWMKQYSKYYGWHKTDTWRDAVKKANEGYLTIGIYSDKVKDAAHTFVVHPNPDDPNVMYQTQAGAWSSTRKAMSEKMTVNQINARQDSSVRRCDNSFIDYYYFDGDYQTWGT